MPESTALQPFKLPGDAGELQVLMLDGEPWFVAFGVAMALGYRDASNACRILPDDEVSTHLVSSNSASHRTRALIISEAGLYRLMLRSDKAEARQFQRWVTREVLPAIRKTGAYAVDPYAGMEPREREIAMLEDRAAGLRRERELEQLAGRQALELEAATPKAEAWDAMAGSGADYSVRQAAFILGRAGIRTGQGRLFASLRDMRMVDRADTPYQAHAARLTLRPRTRPNREGEQVPAKPQVRVTVAGLEYLHKKLGGTAPLTLDEPED